ncbi:extracellular solute-binding protein [Paenibacillus wenxiniae]|uniref:Extracellular solute-binding protein n=1 Tax=Paenibacillus wenxiniae TaxID=1636843 RepID=A0ABW4RGW5_9BACL
MKKWTAVLAIPLLVTMLATGCSSTQSATAKDSQSSDNANKPSTWIADRVITGLIFEDAGDVSTEMNPDIARVLKEKTGITLKIQGVSGNDSTQALAAGLAAGDLPDFVGFYLDNSGRPEMPILLKAAREGMFTDVAPYLKQTNIYSKYFQPGYLPMDSQKNIVFRPEFNGAAYLVNMDISRNPGYVGKKYVGGPYVRKDIMDKLGIDPASIQTSQQLYELAQKMQAGHFTDANGKPITPIGPTVWGGKDVDTLFNDLVWTGPSDEKFLRDASGTIKFESQTDYPLKRIQLIQNLRHEQLISPEFFTMSENEAREGVLNHSFGIVADMHNYIPQNNDMTYVPLGPINFVNGPYYKQLDYKSYSAGWAIPTTTEHPEDIVKLADFLASREGKLLFKYGIEGRDYTLDSKGNPIVKKSVVDLMKSNPAEAEKLGFSGVGNYWGEYLGLTDIDDTDDFGEAVYGEASNSNSDATAKKILQLWHYDERRKQAKIVDGLTPLSFLSEFDRGDELNQAINNYKDSLIKAYFSDNMDQARAIMNDANAQLNNGQLLDRFIQFLNQKESQDKITIKF